MSDAQLPARLLARGRDEGITIERQRILDILLAVRNEHYSAPARHALKEIERRIYDVEAMPS
jgi:hypothetical protein